MTSPLCYSGVAGVAEKSGQFLMNIRTSSPSRNQEADELLHPPKELTIHPSLYDYSYLIDIGLDAFNYDVSYHFGVLSIGRNAISVLAYRHGYTNFGISRRRIF